MSSANSVMMSRDAAVMTTADAGSAMKPDASHERHDAGSEMKADAATVMTPDTSAPPPAPECMHDEDCPAPKSPCEAVRCAGGKCEVDPLASDMVLASSYQVAGDCRSLVCDGKGVAVARPDDTDVPAMTGGEPCHNTRCSMGERMDEPSPDGQACNGTGTCTGGACSVCKADVDCTLPGDCTSHATRCDQGRLSCADTQKAIAGKVCGAGKVCDSKAACTDCVVGATCGGSGDPCQPARITSCDTGPVCTSGPAPDGTSCGGDARTPKQCSKGRCLYACLSGACSTGNPCQVGHWMCGDGSAAPSCIGSPAVDGTACGTDSSCHASKCSADALVNGMFKDGLRGWSTSGDGGRFPTWYTPGGGGQVSTWIDPTGDAIKGTISQNFVVPSDALALRFRVTGGHAHVVLSDASGNRLGDVIGRDSNDLVVPVSWDLTAQRGKTLILSIQDNLDQNGWNFVTVQGFEVVRDASGPLVNSQFADGLNGWDATGDGQYFFLFDDSDYATGTDDTSTPQPQYGTRRSVSTYGRDMRGTQADATVGTLSQRFVVPPDALTLRCNVSGGKAARVALYDGSMVLYSQTGNNTNIVKTPVAWDLTPFVGKTLRVAIEDMASEPSWNFVGVSGFDLITSYNGP